MLPTESELPDSADVLKALGQLALAASQAEARAAQGLYYLLTDAPGDEEGAARISAEFRSFDSLCKLLSVAMHGETPLRQMLEAARSEALKVDRQGDPQLSSALADVAAAVGKSEYLATYTSRAPSSTPVDYVKKVKALYDKRNECLHALGIEAVGHEAHLYKHRKDGTKTMISPRSLVEPCAELRYYEGMTLARAIEAVSLELEVASLPLAMMPITVQWFRRRGTPMDYAPLVDHYVALAVRPLDDQIDQLKEMEATLQSKLDAYEASRSSAGEATDQES